MSDPLPGNDAQYELFLQHFTQSQLRVFAYVRALVYDRTAANDVYQETCLALWRNFSTFDPNADFSLWAIGVARRQVLKYWRTQNRDRHVFSDEVLVLLADEAVELSADVTPRQIALDECVGELSERQRELIRLFYGENLSAAAIAQRWNRSVHAVYKSLKVLRRALLECVEGKLASDP